MRPIHRLTRWELQNLWIFGMEEAYRQSLNSLHSHCRWDLSRIRTNVKFYLTRNNHHFHPLEAVEIMQSCEWKKHFRRKHKLKIKAPLPPSPQLPTQTRSLNWGLEFRNPSNGMQSYYNSREDLKLLQNRNYCNDCQVMRWCDKWSIKHEYRIRFNWISNQNSDFPICNMRAALLHPLIGTAWSIRNESVHNK